MEKLIWRFLTTTDAKQAQRLIDLCPILLSDRAQQRLEHAADALRNFTFDVSNHTVTHNLDVVTRAKAQHPRQFAPVRAFGSLQPLVEIPGGDSYIGSDSGDHSRGETPLRRSHVTGFRIGRHPITNAEYASFIVESGYPISEIGVSAQISGGSSESADIAALADTLAKAARRGFRPELAVTKPDHPVVEVSWFDAIEFCRWTRTRLPTADEWERAARGEDSRNWPWGDTPDAEKCNSSESGIGTTTPVSRYDDSPPPYGCCDMAGNVVGWTATAVEDASIEAPSYIIKGGCWTFAMDTAQVWRRLDNPPDDLWNALGFRCAAAASNAEHRAPRPDSDRTLEKIVSLLGGEDSSDPTPTGKLIESVPLEQREEFVSLLCQLTEDRIESILGNMKMLAAARATADLAIALAQTMNSDGALMRAQRTLGIVLSRGADVHTAIPILEACVDHHRRLSGEDRALGLSLVALADAECTRNLTSGDDPLDATAARDHLLEAMKIFRQLDAETEEQRVLSSLAWAFRLVGERDSAFGTARLALAKAIDIKDEMREAKAILTAGRCFQDLHASAHAMYCFETAYRKGAALGETTVVSEARLSRFLSLAINDRAKACEYGADTVEALHVVAPEYLDQALNIISNVGTDKLISWALASYLRNVAEADPARIPIGAVAGVAIAYAFDADAVLESAAQSLRQLCEIDLPLLESAWIHGLLALATHKREREAALPQIGRAIQSLEEHSAVSLGVCLRQFRIEILKSFCWWDDALADLKSIRPVVEERMGRDVLITYLDYESHLQFWGGSISAALEACDSASLFALGDPDPSESDQSLHSLASSATHKTLGELHLLRSRILSAIGSRKAFIESEAAKLPFFAAGHRLGMAEQMICQAQVILDAPNDHSILLKTAGRLLEGARSILAGKQGGMQDERLDCQWLYAVGSFYQLHRDWERARAAFEQASSIADTLRDEESVLAILARRVELQVEQPGETPSRDLIDDLVLAAKRRQRPVESTKLLALAGRGYSRRAERQDAHEVLQQSIDQYEIVRRKIANTILRKEWLRRSRSTFELLAENAVLAGGLGQAALVAQQGTKTAALRDLLAESRLYTGAGRPAEQGERIRTLWREIRDMEIALENNAGMIGDEDKDYRNRVNIWRRQHELNALASVEEESPSSNEILAELHDMTTCIGSRPKQTTTVEFLTTATSSLAFVSSRAGLASVILRLVKADGRRLMSVVRTMYLGSDSQKKTPTLEPHLGELHDLLFESAGDDGQTLSDVLERLETKRVIFIPSGPLSLIPLQALHRIGPPGRPAIIDRFEEIVSAPSAHLLVRSARARRQEALTPDTCRVVAVQNPDRSLQNADDEVAILRSLFPDCTVLAHEQATIHAVLDALADADIVHFACHCNLNMSAPYESGLHLADGVLTLSNIYTNVTVKRAQLVTLSACESVRVDPEFADEFLSVASGFVYAGVSSVVSSLWKVDDFATMLLMRHFYQRVSAGMDVAGALASAQRWLRDVTARELAVVFDEERRKADSARTIDRHVASSAWRRFTLMPPDGLPFSDPRYWAAFSFVGC
jgi:CHAT domain-containing protein/formylglycine-generating enzyme required for sulfatase activity/tetratricopeptide (TPR) repeat protein